MQDAFEDFMDRLARQVRGDWFDGKVAGVKFPNSDGTQRQMIALSLRPCDELHCRPEPGNAFDLNAVALFTAGGEQVGYLDARLAAEVTRRTRGGEPTPRCFVRAVRPGRELCGVSFGLLHSAGRRRNP